MKGKGFLKVTGILMIIGGALSAILSIVAIIGIAAFASMFETNTGILYISGILAVISAACELIAGIMGVSNCDKGEKAKVCMLWGIIVAALCVLSVILTVIGGGQFKVLSLLLGLVLPALYIYGAAANNKQYNESQIAE